MVPEENAIDSSVFDDFRGDGGDAANDFVSQLIDQYLVESQSRMVELKDAVERSDAPALKRAAHSLKGNSSTVGAKGLAAICSKLEELARKDSFDGVPVLVVQLEDEFVRVRAELQVELRSAA